ncbi:hypothetical protein Asphe3_09040 [Pseudarthrobacter phenanthrenivorans Sphe3]|uniref:DUF6318 domain-containing protein n=1 Tax=Pseudarthrobacter phenanthrenivorans (strain DSM 18606 / JCM 16027 / LMG 23796 / Sphe3) TaxID=930171 RepID=F0M2E4_PSEPM|nr:DUF6318 family protein [Pseudarthrobacter phenanthrenivorans]ADX72095.1 hypothetical protein Asphe3_09040 [Pseudarthrobacter phenanthrenivorans Sphe3]
MTTHKLLSAWAKQLGAVSAGVAAVFMLSACAGNAPADPGPESSPPTASATASPTPTPTPTPSAVYKPADASGPAQNVPVPVLPEVAKTETKEGAEAFAKHWFSVLSYSYETGDTAELSELSKPECSFCRGLIDDIEAAWAESKWITGGQIEVPVATAKPSTDGTTQVVLQVLQTELVIHNQDGSPYQEKTPATNAGSVAMVKFADGGWVVSDLGLTR